MRRHLSHHLGESVTASLAILMSRSLGSLMHHLCPNGACVLSISSQCANGDFLPLMVSFSGLRRMYASLSATSVFSIDFGCELF